MAKKWAMRCRLPMDLNSGALLAGMRLRGLQPDDAHQLGELMYSAYKGGVEDGGEPLQWHLDNAAEVLSGTAEYGAPIWPASLGAFCESELIGATVVTDDLEDSETLLAFALVAPAHQGRGVGRELILASGKALADLGRPDWVLAVADGNPALRLYERLGFQVFTPPARRT